jgi:hypothetical protein
MHPAPAPFYTQTRTHALVGHHGALPRSWRVGVLCRRPKLRIQAVAVHDGHAVAQHQKRHLLSRCVGVLGVAVEQPVHQTQHHLVVVTKAGVGGRGGRGAVGTPRRERWRARVERRSRGVHACSRGHVSLRLCQ